ncbi:major facilitator superfamily multidrug efflux transporter [Paraburkholderia hospita]|uniref:Major facilitator superfamily multidrug efflux transporter n=1 Tax=Paraburkholderia hospita TaxID=169430 RepID=A0ABN0FCT8_9BURK|nr:major facilitator superfamily multidrug efflux transporter [Paraburkholderia hospita]OUL70230.1 MFS transporter [Paraburkholderia hospita]
MIDLSFFSQSQFVAAVLGLFAYAACAQVIMTFLPLYLQNAFDWAPVRAGVGMLPFAIAVVAGPYLGARMSRLAHEVSTLPVGRALVGGGNLVTAIVCGHDDYALVVIGTVITGFGAGVLNGDTAIMTCVPLHRTGMASGIRTTTRFTAIVTSIGVLGAVMAWWTHAALIDHLAVAEHLDSSFMSDLLAGDLTHVVAGLSPSIRAIVQPVVPERMVAHSAPNPTPAASITSAVEHPCLFVAWSVCREGAAIGSLGTEAI